MVFEPMLDKTKQPTTQDMLTTVGQPLSELWTSLDQWIRTTYGVEPEIKFGGAKYGWAANYRKGGRPLCSLTPGRGAFTALVVLGAKEGAEAIACLDTFGPAVRSCLENAHVYHDGRWLLINVQQAGEVEDIQRLITFKRRPPRK